MWVDIHRGALLRLDPAAGGPREFLLPERVGAVGLRERGGLVLGLASGFAVSADDGSELTRLADVERDLDDTRLNDGRVDRFGRFVCGGLHEGSPTAHVSAVYRLDADGHHRAIVTGVALSNSICFSPSGDTMYFTDLPSKAIVAYPYDAGAGPLGKPRLFADLSGEPGVADGSTVDADGCVWNAQWGGARIVRYTPAGVVERVIELPVSQPTTLSFGGPDLRTLFVTSARDGLTERQLEREPAAGHVLALDPGAQGLPEPRYAG